LVRGQAINTYQKYKGMAKNNKLSKGVIKKLPSIIMSVIKGATTVGAFTGRIIPLIGWVMLAYNAGSILYQQYSASLKSSNFKYKIMNTLEKLKKFIVDKHLGFKPSFKIDENTSVNHQLGIDGDDDVEFFEQLENEFQVDFQGLEIKKYFSGEGINPFTFILSIFKSPKPPLTLGDISNSIDSGRWINPKN
jgi:hypothetical protein